MLDTHDHGPLTEADLERVRSQLRDALDRLRSTVERTQRVFYEMRLRVAESTSDNSVREIDGAAIDSNGSIEGTMARTAVREGFQQQDRATTFEPEFENGSGASRLPRAEESRH
jgi:hypothetical protein